jgi:hypothetical protein
MLAASDRFSIFSLQIDEKISDLQGKNSFQGALSPGLHPGLVDRAPAGLGRGGLLLTRAERKEKSAHNVIKNTKKYPSSGYFFG